MKTKTAKVREGLIKAAIALFALGFLLGFAAGTARADEWRDGRWREPQHDEHLS